MKRKVLTPKQVLEELDLVQNLDNITNTIDSMLAINPERGEALIQEIRTMLIEQITTQMVDCLAMGYNCAFDSELEREVGRAFDAYFAGLEQE